MKHLTQVCEGEKQSQLLTTTSPLWFWRRIRLLVHFRDKFFVLSFLCCGTSCFKNDFLSQRQKEPISYFNQHNRIFSCIFAGQRAQRAISLPPVIASAISSIVFFDDTSWRSSATALLVKLSLFSSWRRSKSVTTCSSIFCPLNRFRRNVSAGLHCFCKIVHLKSFLTWLQLVPLSSVSLLLFVRPAEPLV